MKSERKRNKGSFGYIRAQRKKQTIWTIVCFAISLGIFISGYVTTGTRLNLLTVVAVLGCLPASRSAVSMIMYYKAKGCPDEVFAQLQNHKGSIEFLYDLYFTSYKENYPIGVLMIGNKAVTGYSSENIPIANAEKHIFDILKQNGYGNYVVKIFGEMDRFVERCNKVNENGQTNTDEEVRQLLLQISL